MLSLASPIAEPAETCLYPRPQSQVLHALIEREQLQASKG
jgi:hypothetical protein